MSERALRRWTVEEFFAWQERQDERYELVEGVPLRMMTGARAVHNDIVINVLAGLHRQLRGKDCRPFNADGSVQTGIGNIRRPDAGVECGTYDPNGLKAVLPRLVVEILSPSTQRIDLFVKLLEYQRLASLFYVLYIDPDEPSVAFWSREAEGEWQQQSASALDDVIEMPAIGISLAMSDIYERVIFAHRPV